MRHNYNYLSWGFVILILSPIFSLVNARPRASSGKYVRRQTEKYQTFQHSHKGEQLRNNKGKELNKDNGEDRFSSASGNRPAPPDFGIGDDEPNDKESQLLQENPADILEQDNEASSENINGNQDDDEEESSQNSDGEADNNQIKEQQKFVKRSLKTGDIFTPHELLPVTTKLMNKLNLGPGEGRGIISSSKNAQDMADRIFAAYFATMKRIIILKEDDIEGLDALQALAIEGEPANLRYFDKTAMKMLPHKKRSVLMKKISKRQIDKGEDRRRKIVAKLKKHMAKNRLLTVNVKPGRGMQKPRNGVRAKGSQTRTGLKSYSPKHGRRNEFQKRGCTWRYNCRNPDDIDTCDLVTKCMNETIVDINTKDNLNTDIPKSEQKKDVTVDNQPRRSTGVTPLDEEVEKIIESHIALIKPENPNERIEKIESLDQYFNNIIISQNEENSSPIPLKAEEESESKGSDSKDSLNNNSEDENSEDVKKSSDMKPYPAQIDENSAKERDWRPPPFGLPLRQLAEPRIDVLMSDASHEGSLSGGDTINTDKSAARKVTPKIVRLVGG